MRSAKTVGFCQDLEATRQFAWFWHRNLLDAHRVLKRREVLWIPFDPLVADREAWLDRIEAFTGIRGIDRGVMDHRIRDYHGEAASSAELTGEEAALIRKMQEDTPMGGASVL